MAAHAQGSPEALRIIARIEAARSVLGAEIKEARQRLDVPARIRQSILTKPLVWLGGSAAGGLLISLIFRGRRSQPKKEEKRRGIFGFLLGSAFTLARPALEAWAMKELRNRIAPAMQERR